MKKFLTVLLALSVVFTYSFSAVGTAFAANPTYTYDQAVAELNKAETDTINSTKDAMTVALAQYDATAKGYSKDAAKIAYQDIFDAAEKAIKKEADNQRTTLYEASKTATEDKYDIADNVAAIQACGLQAAGYNPSDVDLSKAEVGVVKAKVLADVNAINLDVYSKEVASGELKSNYDKASELVTKAVTILEAQNGTDNKADNDTSIQKMGWIYKPAVGTGEPSGALYTNDGSTNDKVFGVSFTVENADGTKYCGLKDIPTVSGEVVEGNKLEYAKTKALAEILGTLAADKDKYVDDYTAQIFAEKQKAKPDSKKIADLEEKLADVKAAYDDTVEVVTYLVNNAEKVSQLGSFDANNKWQGTNWLQAAKFGVEEFGRHPIDAASKAKYLTATFRVNDAVKRVALVKEAKENAELLKATIAIDGSSAVEIDKALEKAIDEIYKGTKTDAKISGYNAYEYLHHYVEDDLIGGANDTVKINGVTYKSIGAWDVAAYDAAKKPEVRAIINDAKATVRAAATVAEADEAFLAAKAKLDAVPTAAQHERDFTLTTGAYYKDYNNAKKDVEAAAAAKIAALEKLGLLGDYSTTDLQTLVDKYVGTTAKTGELYTECFTAEEIAAKLAEAKNAIEGLKTDKVLADEAAAIEKEVAALPNEATIADKNAVMAAYDKVLDHNAYCDLVDSDEKVSYAKVEKLANLVKAAEYKALTDAIKEINKDGKVTLDEKAAVEALRDAWDAYDAFYADYDKLDSTASIETTVAGFEGDISALEIKEVLNMIAKLPADGSDAAAVKAARDAFNALDRDQQHIIRHNYDASYDKLVDAEKMMVTEVESLKLTASSTAKKGSITVKWKVKGDASAVTYYEVRKSTKKNSGFGTKPYFKTTKKTYKNTKELKKGTRYYYKVRAVAEINGVKYTSDWSNKAYRIAK